MTDSEDLERLAREELLSEAKRAAVRASVSGPSGWQKCPLPKTNKKFLTNTLLHTLSSNRTRGGNVSNSPSQNTCSSNVKSSKPNNKRSDTSDASSSVKSNDEPPPKKSANLETSKQQLAMKQSILLSKMLKLREKKNVKS